MVQVLSQLSPGPSHPWVDTSPGPLDDAALVSPDLSGPTRLVMTIDVVTPMVDDPRDFGAIAAANALSDVYAMGGSPQVALSFIGFPTDKLPLAVLTEIARGMSEVCAAAGCAIVGGHTIVDPEPKAGLAVTGVVDAARAWTHGRATPGQVLVLTKALGTGIVIQAAKKLEAPEDAVRAATASMRQLNDRARDAGLEAGATSATDVTGFGLLGHLKNMCDASGVGAHLEASALPVLPGALALCERGLVPGGTKRNLSYVGAAASFHDAVPQAVRLLLADAQTSGGLLLAVPRSSAEALCRRLEADGGVGRVIGAIEPRGDGATIRVSP
ncbi:MAG: selenide, water dikinase SelD [Polyangiaceae bacterium]|nr:selenide, water dikinase SelD [Polyangiaceae bacterium]